MSSQLTTEATVAAVANKVTYGGGGMAFWGGVTANEIAAYGGLLIGLIGLLVQVYFKLVDNRRKREADLREREEHVIRMAVLAKGRDDGE